MSLMTVCPECKAQVGVPDGTHPTAQVRCPLCEVEFSFGESIPDDLPEVVVVDPGFAEPAAEESALAGAAKAAEEASAQTVEGTETGEDAAVKTDDGADEETKWFAPDDGDERVDSGFSFDPFGDSESSAGDQGDGDQSDSEKAAGDEGEKEGGGVATADGDEETIADPSFSFSPFGDSDDHEPDFGGTSFGDSDGEGGTATATAAKPKKKGMGLKGQVIGIVVFGVIGLGLGYGILKMVKPAAAAPFDKMFVGAWNSVASLWGGGATGDGTAAANGSGETGKRQGSNQSDDDGGIGLPGGMLTNPPSRQDLDNALAGAQTPNIDDDSNADNGVDGADDGGFVLPDPVEVEPSPKLTFRSLLDGQPDASGVFAEFNSQESQAALEKALNVGGDDSSNLPTVYFALCDLGHKLALAPDVDDPEVSVQLVDAEQLISLAAPPEKHASFEKFSNQWLFANRPPAYKDKVGVFLVGKVSKVRKNARVASLYATEVSVPVSGGSDRSLIVLTAKDPGLGNGDTVGVLGMTVQDAESKLPAYDPQAIVDEFGAAPPLLVLGAAVAALD